MAMEPSQSLMRQLIFLKYSLRYTKFGLVRKSKMVSNLGRKNLVLMTLWKESIKIDKLQSKSILFSDIINSREKTETFRNLSVLHGNHRFQTSQDSLGFKEKKNQLEVNICVWNSTEINFWISSSHKIEPNLRIIFLRQHTHTHTRARAQARINCFFQNLITLIFFFNLNICSPKKNKNKKTTNRNKYSFRKIIVDTIIFIYVEKTLNICLQKIR